MRKILAVGIMVLLAAAGVGAMPAYACPYCGPSTGWCVGWDVPTDITYCIQNIDPYGNPYCNVTMGACNETWLDIERLAPDGSLRAIFASIPEYRVVGSDAMHPVAVYEVAGCQSFVVSRSYEAGAALTRRERTAVIFI